MTGRPPREIDFMLELAEHLDDLSDTAPVYGLGYTCMEGGWRPMIMLDAAAAPPGRVAWTPQPWQRIDWWQPTGALRELPDLTVVASGRPLPASGTPLTASEDPLPGPAMGTLIRARGGREHGTVGPRVVLERDGASYSGFLTAGHMLRTGQEVEQLSGGFAWRVWRKLWKHPDDRVGKVIRQEAPVGEQCPAYDFAVVELNGFRKAKWRSGDFVPLLSPARRYEDDQLVKVFAGVSGDMDRLSVQGECMNMGGEWRDCWSIAPAAWLAKGDSGSTVVDRDTGETIGMVVGRSKIGGVVHRVYVQSLGRLMEERLTHEGVLIERKAGRSK